MSDINKSILSFSCVGVNINVASDSPEILEVLRDNFEGLQEAQLGARSLGYLIKSNENETAFEIKRTRSNFDRGFDSFGELILLLEGDLVVQLQLLRSDLLFLHSAVISFGNQAHLLVGQSGAGKSTTCWGLLHHGFRYVSDELAPVSTSQGTVSPYSHALCMKVVPPVEYPIPANTRITDRGCHISPSLMPAPPVSEILPIGSIFFVEYHSDTARSVVTPVSHAEAATRLYSNMLNALAHDDQGLSAALQLTECVPCFRVEAGPLFSTCEVICNAIRKP